jgi:hypothetical protein
MFRVWKREGPLSMTVVILLLSFANSLRRLILHSKQVAGLKDENAFLMLAAAALLESGGVASAQMQSDSLGSTTPAPHQSVAPNVTPDVPNTGGVWNKAKGDGAQSTTGSDAANGGVNGGRHSFDRAFGA